VIRVSRRISRTSRGLGAIGGPTFISCIIHTYRLKSAFLRQRGWITSTGETVEKVPKQILGGDAEKNDFPECATINDLIIMKGCETPKNHALTVLKGFSTVSEVLIERAS